MNLFLTSLEVSPYTVQPGYNEFIYSEIVVRRKTFQIYIPHFAFVMQLGSSLEKVNESALADTQ